MSREVLMTSLTLAGGLAVGALTMYFFDPERGRARRVKAKDMTLGAVRRVGRRAERLGRATGAETYGLVQKVRHLRPAEKDYDDATLAHKIESEIFGDPNVPKGKINVNVEEGVVALRGELDHPEDINAIESKVRKIPGVVDVNNLLHLPGVEPQNKAAARKVSSETRTQKTG